MAPGTMLNGYECVRVRMYHSQTFPLYFPRRGLFHFSIVVKIPLKGSAKKLVEGLVKFGSISKNSRLCAVEWSSAFPGVSIKSQIKNE